MARPCPDLWPTRGKSTRLLTQSSFVRFPTEERSSLWSIVGGTSDAFTVTVGVLQGPLSHTSGLWISLRAGAPTNPLMQGASYLPQTRLHTLPSLRSFLVVGSARQPPRFVRQDRVDRKGSRHYIEGAAFVVCV